MIRRRPGIYLLTLLFITGLAGTINDNTISKAERKSAISIMKDTYKDAVKAISGLSDAQLNYKAAPDKWSVNDCIFHIAASEKLLWSLFEATMNAKANPDKRSEIKFNDEQVINMVEDRSTKVKTSKPLEPNNTGFNSLNDALADFKTNRMNHIKYMKSTTEDLRNHVAQLPFGWIDCYQLYLFIAGHNNRHVQQINEVKADAGFPVK